MRKSNKNRYYCHQRQTSGRVNSRKRILFVHCENTHKVDKDKYAQRLKEVYKYNIQLTIV